MTENIASLGWYNEVDLGKKLDLRANEEDLHFFLFLVGKRTLCLSNLVFLLSAPILGVVMRRY